MNKPEPKAEFLFTSIYELEPDTDKFAITAWFSSDDFFFDLQSYADSVRAEWVPNPDGLPVVMLLHDDPSQLNLLLSKLLGLQDGIFAHDGVKTTVVTDIPENVQQEDLDGMGLIIELIPSRRDIAVNPLYDPQTFVEYLIWLSRE